MLCGVEPGDWDRVAAAAASWPGARVAFGLHPWHIAGQADAWPARLEYLLTAHAGTWLGEAGLDGLKTDPTPLAAQGEALRLQLELARRLGRPVNLHCVRAWPELLALLDDVYGRSGPSEGFVAHSFAGPHQFIKPLVARGAYFSVGPLFSRRDSQRHRRRCALLPEDRLLVESDAFLAPGRDAGSELVHTLRWLAEARDRRPEALAEAVAANSRRLFDHA